MINENLLNRATKVIEKDVVLNEDTKQDILDGVKKIGTSRNKIDDLIQSTKIASIQNSFQLLLQRIMAEDKDGVIEMLDNNRDVIKLFEFTETMNELLTEYGWYRNLYNEDYPEIKKIKENLVLKEKDLLPLLTEILKTDK
jgi:hypothetical protein